MSIFKKKNKEIVKEEIVEEIEEKEKPLSRSEIQRLEKEKIEEIVRSKTEFIDGKVIHTVYQNAIAFSPLGNIGIFTDEFEGMKLFTIKDIKKISYKKPKKDEYGDYIDPFYCILTVNDFNNPIINLTLDYDIEEATDLFNEIKGTYDYLKSN